MPRLLRTQAEVTDASMDDLVHTWNELRGESRSDFPSITVARTQVRMAILSAENESGKAGVAPGAKPFAKTVKELGFNPYKEGTMSHELYEAVHSQAPITPRPKKAELPAEQQRQRLVINKVRATFAGTSRPQAGSTRAAVLKFIQEAKDHVTTVQALEEHFKQPCRGYLQKLLEKNHITLVEEKE